MSKNKAIWMLKFNHGVEIGAHLAYLGHYGRTGNKNIQQIAQDEVEHRQNLKTILASYKHTSSRAIDTVFWIIGNIIRYLCYILPEFMLNKVAQCLEIFAVFSYDRLSVQLPEWGYVLSEMADKEKEHEEYFRNK